MKNIEYELEVLQSPQRTPCISLIVPTYGSEDSIRVKLDSAVQRTKELLAGTSWKEDTQNMIQRLKDLCKQIEITDKTEGLGLFISPDLARIVYFPMPVKERVVVGNNFELKDIVFILNRTPRYWVLSLSDTATRLFKGFGNSLTEIQDNNFPFASDEKDHTIDKGKNPSLGKIDLLLTRYFKGVYLPVIVLGKEKHLKDLSEISIYKNEIIGWIPGNFDKVPLAELLEFAWKDITKFLKQERKKSKKEFEVCKSKNLCTCGLKEVSKAVRAGKGKVLLVEKNFMTPYYMGVNSLEPIEKKKMLRKISDVVDDIIAMVIRNGGKAVFMENGDLKQHEHIALILN